jgi:hypothetical protein
MYGEQECSQMKMEGKCRRLGVERSMKVLLHIKLSAT